MQSCLDGVPEDCPIFEVWDILSALSQLAKHVNIIDLEIPGMQKWSGMSLGESGCWEWWLLV